MKKMLVAGLALVWSSVLWGNEFKRGDRVYVRPYAGACSISYSKEEFLASWEAETLDDILIQQIVWNYFSCCVAQEQAAGNCLDRVPASFAQLPAKYRDEFCVVYNRHSHIVHTGWLEKNIPEGAGELNDEDFWANLERKVYINFTNLVGEIVLDRRGIKQGLGTWDLEELTELTAEPNKLVWDYFLLCLAAEDQENPLGYPRISFAQVSDHFKTDFFLVKVEPHQYLIPTRWCEIYDPEKHVNAEHELTEEKFAHKEKQQKEEE